MFIRDECEELENIIDDKVMYTHHSNSRLSKKKKKKIVVEE